MDKYGLKKRYDFVPQFSPLRPGTFSCSGHYLIPRNEPQKSCATDDVAVDFVAITTVIYTLIYISSYFNFNENIRTPNDFIKTKVEGSTDTTNSLLDLSVTPDDPYFKSKSVELKTTKTKLKMGRFTIHIIWTK